MSIRNLRKWTIVLFLVLLANTAYVWGFPSPTVVYMGSVLFHVLCGIVCASAFLWLLARDAGLRTEMATPAGLFIVAFLLGAWLTGAGATSDHRWAISAHIVAAFCGAVALLRFVWARARRQGGGWLRVRHALVACLTLALVLPAAGLLYRRAFPNPADRIRNPRSAPLAMEFEGSGPKSPFFPSASKTNVGGIIPSNFFMDSEACGECHKDIYEQWKGSMHHFGSFNNQFYRKSIEYMQSVVGPQPSKWCAGCHDHAVFFNGRFDRPIKEQIDTPEAQAGLGCMSCHAIVHVASSMGNADFTVEYPPLHEMASSHNRYIRAVDYFLTFL